MNDEKITLECGGYGGSRPQAPFICIWSVTALVLKCIYNLTKAHGDIHARIKKNCQGAGGGGVIIYMYV